VTADPPAWYAGRYLGLPFTIHLSPGFGPGALAGFLDAHCDPPAPGDATCAAPATLDGARDNGSIAQRFHLGPAHAFPGLLASAVRDHGGAWRVDDPAARTRWYLGTGDAASFGVVQDLYCGLRRIAARRLPRAALLHAATIELGDHTVLLLGDKRCGKSFASYACLLAGAGHVASDKTCIWASPAGLRCAGLIGSIRLSLADAAHFAGVPAHAAVCDRLRAAARDPGRVIGDKICLDPTELCRLIGARTVTTARPTALVVLQPDGPIAVTALDPRDAAEQLARLTLADHGRDDPGLDAAVPAGLLADLVRSCRCLRLTGRPPASWLPAGLLAAL
jgi:hypothetical protein